MSILTDPDQIEHFRLLTLWRGLGLELKGMKMSRGTSCYKSGWHWVQSKRMTQAGERQDA